MGELYVLLKIRMLKTDSKESLPKGESYVLSATEISELLDGVPHYEEFSIVFSQSNSEYYRNAKKLIHSKGVSFFTVKSFRRDGIFFSRERLKEGTVSPVSYSIYQNSISSQYRQGIKMAIYSLRDDLRRCLFESGKCDVSESRAIEIDYNFTTEVISLKDILGSQVHLIREVSITL